MKIGLNISIGILFLILWVVPCLGECPSADLTGDCRVDLRDLAVFAGQWLSGDGIPEDMVVIPGGTFQMGDSFNEGNPDQLPVHTVTLRHFFMSKYLITNGQYCAFLNAVQPKVVNGTVYGRDDITNSYPYFDTSSVGSWSQIAFTAGAAGQPDRYVVRFKGRSDMSNDPAVCVSWYGAVAYCNWRSQREGKQPCYDLSTWACDFSKYGYRLPTEAEWEYAARGGLAGKRFPWGNTISHDLANYKSDDFYSYDVSTTRGTHPIWSQDGIMPYTSPVGSFAANGYRLYDMAGNVFEWCQDWHSESYYSESPNTNPKGPATGADRVLRCGDWADNATATTVARRIPYFPTACDPSIGFRIVFVIK